MFAVALELVPPAQEHLTALEIYESTTPDGPFTLIERVEGVGSFPEYIDSYTTDQASSPLHWFTIRWFDSKGASSHFSSPIKGGAQSLVGIIVDRVRQRDVSMNIAAVTHEAEAAIEYLLGDDVDPYTTDQTLTYRQTNGLVYLVMARVLMATPSLDDSVAIGLVSMRSPTQSSKDVNTLLELANAELGLNVSRIMQMRTVRNGRHAHWVTEP